ncbi:YhdT family protein [Guptibacillus algicola]|uniref:YhdT family protein n=1 Tax=Guptibacillus algicola TaxID=225844 RepID=UPI001CD53FD8|nr:YhdT family protein [Alkalihalobacillus algicola]MCA0986976.1 YhdT family protein [Alkalihalobacillus algicola]
MNKEKRENGEDPRFQIANREALIGIGLVVINFLLWYGTAYGFGSKPVAEYNYIWGLPAWFFYSCIVVTLVMLVLVIVSVKFLYKEVPLDEEEDN